MDSLNVARPFSFDEREHIYRLGDAILPSVTGIIKSCGYISEDWLNELARLRGQNVHKAIELYLKGTLDEGSIRDDVKPYLEAAMIFCGEHSIEYNIAEVERPNYHHLYLYAGTPDLPCKVKLKHDKYKVPVPAIIDIKTGAYANWHSLQTAAYAMILDHVGFKAWRRFALYLKSDANYELREHADESDYATFKACLTVYNHKAKGRE